MRLVSEPDIAVDDDDFGSFYESADDRQQSRQLATIELTGLIGGWLLYSFRHFKIGIIIRPIAKEETGSNGLSFSVMNIRARDHFFSGYNSYVSNQYPLLIRSRNFNWNCVSIEVLGSMIT